MFQIIQTNTVSRQYLARGGKLETVVFKPGRIIRESLSRSVIDRHAERLRTKFPEVRFRVVEG